MKNVLIRRVLLALALAFIICDLGVWLYYYFVPPAPPWLGTFVGLVAALAVILAVLGGLSDLVGLPPEEPWDGQEKL
jgi:hypothetical protein